MRDRARRVRDGPGLKAPPSSGRVQRRRLDHQILGKGNEEGDDEFAGLTVATIRARRGHGGRRGGPGLRQARVRGQGRHVRHDATHRIEGRRINQGR